MENNKLVEVNMTAINLENCKSYLQFQVCDEIHDVKIVGTFDELWFCGKFICNILGYSNIKNVSQDHVKNKHNSSPSELKNLYAKIKVPYFW